MRATSPSPVFGRTASKTQPRLPTALERRQIARLQELDSDSLANGIERGRILRQMALKWYEYQLLNVGIDRRTGDRLIALVEHPRMRRKDWARPNAWTTVSELLQLDDRTFERMHKAGLITAETTRRQVRQFAKACQPKVKSLPLVTTKTYQIVYADPPWRFEGLGSKGIRSAKMRDDDPGLHSNIKIEDKYPTMSVDELKALPVGNIAADNSVLFMWTTDAHLPYAIEIMRAWGFEYATVAFVWLKKERTGKQVCYYSYWTMKGTELCLLGRRGNVKPVAHNVRQLVEAARTEHSRKPEIVRDRIVALIGDVPRIELFARQTVAGWDAWGDEVVNLNVSATA
jgi:N6-adenosine-specific RNA methylase IME4